MTDRTCPECGADGRSPEGEPDIWRCGECGSVYQEFLRRTADGVPEERIDVHVLQSA